MNSLPTSLASTGLCRCAFGNPGIAPRSTSSMLGCSAPVTEIVSPSQPRPAVIQTIWTSLTSGGRPLNVDAVVAIFRLSSLSIVDQCAFDALRRDLHMATWQIADDGPALLRIHAGGSICQATMLPT